MPRNNQGLYTLPSGNPVKSGTLIESVWANTTMQDLADALTGSLPRDGNAPMTGELTLLATDPVNSRSAVSKGYVDQFMAYSTGFPIGAVVPLAGSEIPGGFLLCDGSAVSRETYSDLFGTLGTIYGEGDGSTTFNIPDLRSQFVRGRGDDQTLGSIVNGTLESHIHPVVDPEHSHDLNADPHTHVGSQVIHSHTTNTEPHGHTVLDSGHAHDFLDDGTNVELNNAQNPGSSGGFAGGQNLVSKPATESSQSGIIVQVALGIAGTTNQQKPDVTISNEHIDGDVTSEETGITIGATGDTETAPDHVLLDYYIKALPDEEGPTTVSNIDSNDTNMISIDNTNPAVPVLDIHSNVAYGTVKLDQGSKIPISLLPAGVQTLLGLFDASSGLNPSEAYPTTDFSTGDSYMVSVDGTITILDTAGVEGEVAVEVGWTLIYIENSVSNPDGWYYSVPSSTTAVASEVALIPVGAVTAADVQNGIGQLDGFTTDLDTRVTDVEADTQTVISDLDTHVNETGSAVHGLGTASLADITTTSIDTTAGSALKVNDFGIGDKGISNLGNNILTIDYTGFYHGNSMNGAPDIDEYFVTANRIDNANRGFILQNAVNNELFISTVSTGLLLPWKRIYDENNAVGEITETGGAPSGGIIDSADTVTGSYIKYRDGTLICVGLENSDDAGPSEWVYPHAFVAQPEFAGVTAINSSTLILSGNIVAGEFSTSAFSFQVCNVNDARVFVSCRLIAVGRWY